MVRNIEDPEVMNTRIHLIKKNKNENLQKYEDFIAKYVAGHDLVLDFGSSNHSESTTNIGLRSAHEVVCENNKNVIAVDVEPHDSLMFANSVYKTLDLTSLTKEQQRLEIGQVDLIFAGNVIEHLSNPGNLFQLAKNCLPPGGVGNLNSESNMVHRPI